MSNAAVGVVNLADDDYNVLTVSDAIALAPGSRLLNPHVGHKWQVNDDNAYILLDFGAATELDTVMLAGLTGTDPDFRVRGSSADATGAAGDVFDSGTISGIPYFDPDHGKFVYLRDASSPRYLRIDATETGVDSIAAGRLGVWLRDQFTWNMQTPWTRTAVRATVDQVGVGGQTFTDRRFGHWRQTVRFNFATEAERTGFLETIGTTLVNEGHIDLLLIPNPESTNLSRDCIFGYIEGEFSLMQDNYTLEPVYSVEFTVRQRR